MKFLIIQPLDRQQEPKGDPVVAADAVHMAGPGELVYFVSAREAAEALPNTFVPVDHAIVGIVDAVAELVKVGRVVGTVVSTINARGLRRPPPTDLRPPRHGRRARTAAT